MSDGRKLDHVFRMVRALDRMGDADNHAYYDGKTFEIVWPRVGMSLTRKPFGAWSGEIDGEHHEGTETDDFYKHVITLYEREINRLEGWIIL